MIFLNVEADSISWLLPAKKYIIDSALLEYQKSFDNKIFFEKINNQLGSYFDYVKKIKVPHLHIDIGKDKKDEKDKK